MGIIETFEKIISYQSLMDFIPVHHKHSHYFIYKGQLLEAYIGLNMIKQLRLEVICLVEGMEDTNKCTDEQLIYIVHKYFREA